MSGMAIIIIFDIVGASNSNIANDTTTRQSVIGNVIYIIEVLVAINTQMQLCTKRTYTMTMQGKYQMHIL
jgi:hypothetical protein